MKKYYYSFIKNIWSNDFNKVVANLSKINSLEFLIKQDDRILFKVNQENLNETIEALSLSVKIGAWHDLTSNNELVVVFNPTDVRKVSLGVPPDDATWLKMRELEPSVRKYQTLKEMIMDSVYEPYLTLDSAIEFSTKKFEAVNKKNHFLRVLAVLQNEFCVEDEEVLMAAVLHDTLEDTDTTYEELEETFSKNVADLVQEVSHPKDYNKSQKLEFYEKLKTISLKAKIIKLADFTDNLRNIILQRKADPQSPYHNQYILWIREFLDNCHESDAKNLVFELTKELELYVTT